MSIKIFSWNVQWSSMQDQTKNNKAVQIINILTNNYDFIALQEASYLYDKLKSISIKDYEIVFSNNKGFYPNDKDSTNKLITLYDSNKYKLIAKRYGSIYGYNSTGKPSKRPFHILFLQDNNNNNKILFINLHNVHDVKRNLVDLQNTINNIINDPKFPIYYIPEDVHIIISGDFNDKSTQYYKNGLHIKINTTKTILVKSNNIPPKTCCLSHYNLNYNLIGDYILYSDNFNVKIDNTIYQENKISDHYPVHVELYYKQTPAPAPASAPAPAPASAPAPAPAPASAPAPAPAPASAPAPVQAPVTKALEKLSVLINKYIDLLEKN